MTEIADSHPDPLLGMWHCCMTYKEGRKLKSTAGWWHTFEIISWTTSLRVETVIKTFWRLPLAGVFFVWIKESQLTFLNFIRYIHVGFQLQLILNVIIFNTLLRITIGELLTGKIRVAYNALMFETDDQVLQLTCELYKSHNRPIRSLGLNWNKLC